jgi:dihydroflavonol-4-reductase
MSRVLVTGANGFLGSWLCQRLLSDGHEVFAVVRKGSDLSEIQHISDSKFKLIHGEITNLESLEKAYSETNNVNATFHLAGLVSYKATDRDKMHLVNVTGTENVISCVKKLSSHKLIHVSSVVSIGAGFSAQQILDENSEYNLTEKNFGYFETKKLAEEKVKAACLKSEIDAVIVNPSTIYGAGDAKKGSRKTQVKVAQGKFPFYPPGGVNVVSVEDVCQGIISAWNKGRNGERYILASENLLIKDVFEIIANVAKVKAPQFGLPKSALLTLGWLGDLMAQLGLASSLSLENAEVACLYHWFSHAKATKELDFKPQPSHLAIEKSVLWMKQNGLV